MAIPRPDIRNGLIVAAFVAAGVLLLGALGAPLTMLVANGAGLLCGLVVYAAVHGLQAMAPPILVTVATSVAMLAVAFFGFDLDGVHRWVRVGPFTLHAGFVLFPLLIGSLGGATWIAALAFAVAGFVAWLQPDVGMAAALALAALGFLAAARTMAAGAAAVLALAAAIATWLRPDPLDPAQFVEHVPELAWSQHPVLGVIAFLLLAALPAPFVVLGARDAGRRTVCWSIAGFWSGAAVASLAGHFPTPVIGMGIGPIIGYAVSLAVCAATHQRSAVR